MFFWLVTLTYWPELPEESLEINLMFARDGLREKIALFHTQKRKPNEKVVGKIKGERAPGEWQVVQVCTYLSSAADRYRCSRRHRQHMSHGSHSDDGRNHPRSPGSCRRWNLHHQHNTPVCLSHHLHHSPHLSHYLDHSHLLSPTSRVTSTVKPLSGLLILKYCQYCNSYCNSFSVLEVILQYFTTPVLILVLQYF